jgi:hypothetical protein
MPVLLFQNGNSEPGWWEWSIARSSFELRRYWWDSK